jgi:site-specific recombinase XerD
MACLTREKGKYYRVHWKFNITAGPEAGRLIEGSFYLGRCLRRDAKVKLREIETWEEAVKTGRHLPSGRWEEIYELWLRERTLALTPQSVDRCRRVVSLYERWRQANHLPCHQIQDLACRQDLIRWRDYRLDHEAGRKTVANDLATLGALFKWCVHERFLTDNPVDRITRPRFIRKKEGMPLTRTQAGRWLRSIQIREGRGGHGPRTWAEVRRKRQLAVFFLNTGLRNGELCSLNIEDLRVDADEQLLYVMGKGQKERWVPLNIAALAAVRCHLRSRGNPTRGPLFVTCNNERYNVRQLASEFAKTGRGCAETISVNPHNLRHTFATWLARSVSNVALAQKILGHEDVNTTLRYYVHTGDYELAGATAGLRSRRDTQRLTATPPADDLKLIPFPQRHVG